MDMLGWQTIISPLIRALSYTLVALAVAGVFRHRNAAFLGWHRWLVVAALLLSAASQFVLLASRGLGLTTLNQFARVFDASFLLAAALMVRPFLAQMTRRMSRRTGYRLREHFRRARRQAAQSRRLLELGEEMSHAGHWTISVPGREVFWSDEIYRIHGLDKASFAPDYASAAAVIHPDDRVHVEALIAGAIVGKTGFEFEARLLRPDGEVRDVMSRGMPTLDAAGEVTGMFGVFMDLTQQTKIQAQLRAAIQAAKSANEALGQMALVDSLTGLPNRRHFDTALETEFRRAVRERRGLGVIMIDLDHFKGYNDHYGHPAGDECLRKIAAAIAAAPRRPGDLAARFGGEEFSVLLPHTDAAGTREVATLILESVAALQIPHAANAPLIATVSCGAAVFVPGRDEQIPLALVRRADQALYDAKRGGRNRVVSAADAPVGLIEARRGES